MIPWNGAMLFPTYPNCSATTFMLFNEATQQLENTNIPDLSNTGYSFVAGSNNDIWSYSGNKLYYYSAAHNEWNLVSLANFPGATVHTIEWDSINNYLLVYVYRGGRYGILGKVTTASYPPSEVTQLLVGGLATYGKVYAVATSQQQNSDNFGLPFPLL